MMTLRQFSAGPSTIPTITSWYLTDLSKAQRIAPTQFTKKPEARTI